MILEKYPDMIINPEVIWKLDHLDTSISVLELNNYLFQNDEKNFDRLNSRLRSYTEYEIIRILKYQDQYKKTNTEIVKKYGMSRTTLITWQKKFKHQIDVFES